MKYRKICLDACVMLREEDDPQRRTYDEEVYTGIATLMEDVELGRRQAIVSTAIFAELLGGSYEVLLKRFDGRKGLIVDVDPPIAALARDIRRSIRERPNGKCLDLGDCLYLATAKIYQCDCLVTVEGLGNSKFKMLNVASLIASRFGIRVMTPMAVVDQMAMVFPRSISTQGSFGDLEEGV